VITPNWVFLLGRQADTPGWHPSWGAHTKGTGVWVVPHDTTDTACVHILQALHIHVNTHFIHNKQSVPRTQIRLIRQTHTACNQCSRLDGLGVKQGSCVYLDEPMAVGTLAGFALGGARPTRRAIVHPMTVGRGADGCRLHRR
jgi:hypothetical protein